MVEVSLRSLVLTHHAGPYWKKKYRALSPQKYSSLSDKARCTLLKSQTHDIFMQGSFLPLDYSCRAVSPQKPTFLHGTSLGCASLVFCSALPFAFFSSRFLSCMSRRAPCPSWRYSAPLVYHVLSLEAGLSRLSALSSPGGTNSAGQRIIASAGSYRTHAESRS